MINEFLDNIQQRFVDAFQGFSDFVFIGEWYILGAAVLVAALVIGYFLPFQWTRAALGAVVAMFAAFLAGLQVMRNHYGAQRELDRERIKQLESEKPKSGGGLFGF